MTSGWASGEPVSAKQFISTACNIIPESWPTNAFRWNYPDAEIEKFVKDVVVPYGRAVDSQVMGKNDDLHLLNDYEVSRIVSSSERNSECRLPPTMLTWDRKLPVHSAEWQSRRLLVAE
jgi:hypothetical protein